MSRDIKSGPLVGALTALPTRDGGNTGVPRNIASYIDAPNGHATQRAGRAGDFSPNYKSKFVANYRRPAHGFFNLLELMEILDKVRKGAVVIKGISRRYPL